MAARNTPFDAMTTMMTMTTADMSARPQEGATEKNLIFVTTRLPFPQNSGRKVSLYHYCRGLATRYGYRVHLFTFPEAGEETFKGALPPFISSLTFAPRGSKMGRLFALFLAFFRRNEPFQCALYRSKKAEKELKALVERLHPTAVLFDMIRTAPYQKVLKGTGIKVILDYDDLLSRRYRRQLAAGPFAGSVAGQYERRLSNGFEKRLTRGRMGRLILRAEAKRLEKAEPLYAKDAHGVVFVSLQETAAFNRQMGKNLAVTVPIGVEPAAFDGAKEVIKEEGLFGFVGNLHVPANEASLQVIMEEILPRLGANCRFEVVGKCPESLRNRYENEPRARFLGEVPSLPPVVGRWQFLLSPIPFGSGIKTKVLEGMAMHRAVLTDALGAEGIPAAAGKEILIASTREEMAEMAEHLLAHPQTAAEIGEHAAAFVAAHFAWDSIFETFQALGL